MLNSLQSIGKFVCLIFAVCGLAIAAGQTPAPVTFTADQDHQNMMDQLGIKALRPGPSGNEKAPNHANYDQDEANPYPNVPDPLTLSNGEKVTTPEMWRTKRRPELVEMFSKYVYGRVPENTPKVTWTVTAVDHEMIGFTPVLAKDLIGVVDNSSYPAISVKIHMTLVTPANIKTPVPGVDDVRAGRISQSERTARRRSGPRQLGVEGSADPAGPFAERCVCAASSMGAVEGEPILSAAAIE